MDRCVVVGVCDFWNSHFRFLFSASRISTRAAGSKRNARGTDQEWKHSKSDESWKTYFKNASAGAQRYFNKLDVFVQHTGSGDSNVVLWSDATILSKNSFVEVWGNLRTNWLCPRCCVNAIHGR